MTSTETADIPTIPDHTGNMYDEISTLGNWSNSTMAARLQYFDGDLFIHPHWYQYLGMLEDIPDVVHYILGLYIAFVGLTGTFGNLLVIWIFSTTRSLRTPPNMFIVSLAISDMGFSAINGFPLMTISCFQKKWMWGKMACEIYAFLGGLFGFNSIFTLALISIDRYYVITKPFHTLKHISHKKSAIQISMAWLYSTALSVPPFFGWGAYIPDGFMTYCSYDFLTRDVMNISYNYAIVVFGFLAPVGTIIFSYVSIFIAVRYQGKKMQETSDRMTAKSARRERTRKQEIQIAKISAVTIVLFIISWVPYAIIGQLGINGMSSFVTPYTTQVPVMCAKASAMWNPILYALSHPRFRAVLDVRIPWLVCCRGRNMSQEDRTTDRSSQGSTTGTTHNRGANSKSETSCSEIEITDTAQRVSTIHGPGKQNPIQSHAESVKDHSLATPGITCEAPTQNPTPSPSGTPISAELEDSSEYTLTSQTAVSPSTSKNICTDQNNSSFRGLRRMTKHSFKQVIKAYNDMKRSNQPTSNVSNRDEVAKVSFQNLAYSPDSPSHVQQPEISEMVEPSQEHPVGYGPHPTMMQTLSGYPIQMVSPDVKSNVAVPASPAFRLNQLSSIDTTEMNEPPQTNRCDQVLSESAAPLDSENTKQSNQMSDVHQLTESNQCVVNVTKVDSLHSARASDPISHGDVTESENRGSSTNEELHKYEAESSSSKDKSDTVSNVGISDDTVPPTETANCGASSIEPSVDGNGMHCGQAEDSQNVVVGRQGSKYSAGYV